MQNYYIARHKNSEILSRSSSGGVFSALADAFFSEYGDNAAVYGCVMRYGENIGAEHVAAHSHTELDAMLGSKYIRSDTAQGIRSAAEALEAGKHVLFSGTPCQIEALYAVLDKRGTDPEGSLLTVSLICHGVGSTDLFRDYIASYEKKYRSRAVYVSFRGKSRPSKRQEMVIKFENGKKYISPSAKYDGFLGPYMRGIIIREACFSCRFARPERNSDITLGDHWMNEGQARSTVITSTEEGEKWLERCADMLECERTEADRADQPQLREPTRMPEGYREFWEEYRAHGYDGARRWLGEHKLTYKVKKAVAAVAYHLRLTEAYRALRRRMK